VTVGKGDIARVLPASDKLFFASGVSNSLCESGREFGREIRLLLDQPRDAHIVYFSTLSIFYKDSPYTRHKRYMELLIKEHFPMNCIVRLGNISWGRNPHTLINYLRDHPEAEIRDEYRYVIDKDEFLHWISLIPDFPVEMNCPGRRMKVKEIYDTFCRAAA
jgi:hypothetical protein